MIGPQVQAAVFAALTSADVADGRIFDGVPDGAVFPYVEIGDEQIVDDGNTCSDAWEVFIDCHIWSRSQSRTTAEVKQIGAEIVDALSQELPLNGYSVVLFKLDTARYLDDPDGITKHGIVTMRYAVEEA
ncbi:DUF3168 domain-containing protein [Consotaella salsifontis]|uniref:DUF3168 domain-containing protein n=1 Tax=Consotaella salsifontis TaxID=1365950 RepID=A0A1T4SS80_9HYPH|nr:DUF3168 domain-containing protein [Consotaella salsifontis]SKA31023.1 Protein of unknown function [Consotaella salsifontis]